MRGKVSDEVMEMIKLGITPAHAGKSKDDPDKAQYDPDHPRACGEKSNGNILLVLRRGSPPRMRGKD